MTVITVVLCKLKMERLHDIFKPWTSAYGRKAPWEILSSISRSIHSLTPGCNYTNISKCYSYMVIIIIWDALPSNCTIKYLGRQTDFPVKCPWLVMSFMEFHRWTLARGQASRFQPIPIIMSTTRVSHIARTITTPDIKLHPSSFFMCTHPFLLSMITYWKKVPLYIHLGPWIHSKLNG